MNVIRTVTEMIAARAAMTGSVGLVPTMGYLHEGHLSLVRRARADNDRVIVSIFVNPTQFGPGEDLARYPRHEDRDLALLASERADAVFVPSAEEIYPPGFNEWVEVTGPLTERLEGAHRPGHFRGVTTVVARFFRITRPHRAYFGQKDAQQLHVISRMVRDIHAAHPELVEGAVDVVPMPIVRERDGLAMSSRNLYLSPEQRISALVLYRSLALAVRLVRDGVRDAGEVREAVRGLISSDPNVKLDYASVADEQTLEELDTIDRPALVLLAARVGATRLIDNTILVPAGANLPDRLRALVEGA